VEYEVAADNPEPWAHHLNVPATGPHGTDGLAFALDGLSLHVHGNADTHSDAPCHVAYNGTPYNDLPADTGPWDVAAERAGLHPAALQLLADRRIAVLGSDGNNDTAPSLAEGVASPVHVLAVRALGLMLLDYLQFDDLVPVCEAADRWSFQCVIAPCGSPWGPVRRSIRSQMSVRHRAARAQRPSRSASAYRLTSARSARRACTPSSGARS
jgi:hypothetical protein